MLFLRKAIVPAALATVLYPLMATSPADAAVVISSGVTFEISCNSGVCTPTADNALLNVKQLESMLASGDVTVNSSPNTGGYDIDVDHAITWASSSTLTLNSYGNITIDKPISVTGSGGLTLAYNSVGDILFIYAPGYITFLNLASPLSINGDAYTLVGNISTLASDIAANPSGNFALANSYNATPDGTYASSPVPTTFSGYFNGLGNTISHLAARLTTPQTFGLFENLEYPGIIQNINLDKETITGSGAGTNAGGLVGANSGQIVEVSANVNLINLAVAGGLVATNIGDMMYCYTSGKVDTGKTSAAQAGGLIGANVVSGFSVGFMSLCYSTATVIVGKNSYGGGLVGYEQGFVGGTYATGAVTGGQGSYVGGLVGYAYLNTEDSQVTDSYSTGAVTATAGTAGGLIGDADGGISSTYWDTTTSGIGSLSQGAGTPSSESGITGLSTTQMQSGVPSGLFNKFWAESPSINGRLPYLVALPPNSL